MVVMQFEMGSGGIPAGAYQAEFLGVEPFTENAAQYGEGVLLKWRVMGGSEDGNEATRICSKKFSPKSNLAKFAVALKGSAIAPGESFAFEPFIGTRGTVLVESTESGSTRVSSFLRQPPQQATPPAPALIPPQPVATEAQAY